jgi:hypothetical protein
VVLDLSLHNESKFSTSPRTVTQSPGALPSNYAAANWRIKRSCLRLFGGDFAVFPDANRRAMHEHSVACNLGGAMEDAPDNGRRFFAGLRFSFLFFGDLRQN